MHFHGFMKLSLVQVPISIHACSGLCGWLHQYQPSLRPGTSFWKSPLLTSANEIAHKGCGQPPVMWYNFGCFQPPVVYPGVSICAVSTADTVATGKVNCYNFIVRLHSLPRCVRGSMSDSALHYQNFSPSPHLAVTIQVWPRPTQISRAWPIPDPGTWPRCLCVLQVIFPTLTSSILLRCKVCIVLNVIFINLQIYST